MNMNKRCVVKGWSDLEDGFVIECESEDVAEEIDEKVSDSLADINVGWSSHTSGNKVIVAPREDAEEQVKEILREVEQW
jgi:hypothetical protein